ncbi:hypothetical protein [Halovivax limisalsi]|uniref:hypothetical protein n=1 Tax=Halovivax limisalsi TaxID=1453760 RepID=UPI001FFC94BB|nr:hypothetical protein [Halovivax limisalsi]
MPATRLSRFRLDPPDSRHLRRTYHLLWLIDMVTAVLLITVPYASELNPVTIYFYGLLGYPGVALAAITYAAAVVVVGHYLSHPVDLVFLVAVVGFYLLFVFNNVVVLAFDETLASALELLAEGSIDRTAAT